MHNKKLIISCFCICWLIYVKAGLKESNFMKRASSYFIMWQSNLEYTYFFFPLLADCLCQGQNVHLEVLILYLVTENIWCQSSNCQHMVSVMKNRQRIKDEQWPCIMSLGLQIMYHCLINLNTEIGCTKTWNMRVRFYLSTPRWTVLSLGIRNKCHYALTKKISLRSFSDWSWRNFVTWDAIESLNSF